MAKIVYKLNTENVYISARQVQDTNSKVVIDGAANNWVVYSTEGSAFQDGGNQSNKNIGI